MKNETNDVAARLRFRVKAFISVMAILMLALFFAPPVIRGMGILSSPTARLVLQLMSLAIVLGVSWPMIKAGRRYDQWKKTMKVSGKTIATILLVGLMSWVSTQSVTAQCSVVAITAGNSYVVTAGSKVAVDQETKTVTVTDPSGSVIRYVCAASLTPIAVPNGGDVRFDDSAKILTITDSSGSVVAVYRCSDQSPIFMYDSNGKVVVAIVGVLVCLAVLCAAATWACIHYWPSDEQPPPPPPPPPVYKTNYCPCTFPLPPADYYQTNVGPPYCIIGVITNLPPPPKSHWWNLSPKAVGNGNATVTLTEEKSVPKSAGMVDPCLGTLVNSYHRGTIDIGGGADINGPWEPFVFQFWRSGDQGTVVFSFKGYPMFRVGVTKTLSGNFEGSRPEGFRVAVDPEKVPKYFFKFPLAP